MPQLPFKLDLFGLYGRFIKRKYDVYQDEKFRVQANIIIAREQRERDLKCMRRDHQLLALKVRFTEEQVAMLQSYNQFMLSAEELARFGIAEVNYEGKLHFIHCSFAEYYVADVFVNQLTKGTKTSPQLQDYLLKDIFVKADYRVIRYFIDGLMLSSKVSEEVLKQYGNRVSDLWKDGVPILYQAAHEDNVHIIGFLFSSLQAAEHTDTLVQLLLAQDNDTPTVWHLAVVWCNLQVLQKLWECAKEKITTEDLHNKLLLAKDKRGITAWHLAAACGNLELLQKLWELAKEKLTPEDLKNKLLLAKDNRGQTAWHVAAEWGNVQLLQKLWEWAKEKLTTEDLSNKLLLAKDVRERTTWHVAAECGNLELLQQLWVWAKEVLAAEVISDELLLARDDNEQTFLHVAAKRNNTKEFQKVWDWATEKLSPEEIRRLLLAKDSHELTVLHVGANKFSPKLLEELQNWATENLTPEK
jgi:ankyrin repeat protein